MDMVVNIFVLSFCYVLYMRKERTLSRSKKPDEFSPSAQTHEEFAYLHNFFHPDGFSFSRSELGLKAPRRRHNTTLKFKIQKRKEQLLYCPSVGAKRFLPHFSEVSTESIRAVTHTL